VGPVDNSVFLVGGNRLDLSRLAVWSGIKIRLPPRYWIFSGGPAGPTVLAGLIELALLLTGGGFVPTIARYRSYIDIG